MSSSNHIIQLGKGLTPMRTKTAYEAAAAAATRRRRDADDAYDAAEAADAIYYAACTASRAAAHASIEAEATLAAADIHLQPRRAREDVLHLGPGKVIRRDKLHVHRRIFTAGFFFAKCCSHAAADTRPRNTPQDHSRSLSW